MTGVQGAPWYLNHYFTNADDSAGATQATAAVQAFWDALDGLQANEVVGLIDTVVPVINPVSGEITSVLAGPGGSWAGDSPGLLLPPATQGVIQWRTPVFANGREVRGRSFIPGLTADTLETNGTPTAGTIAGFTAAAAALIGAAPSFCVYSRTHGLAAIVTGATYPDMFGSLRSRRD